MADIPQGTTATIASTGTNAPTSPHTWEIRKGGAVIAHNTDAQGWSVSRDNTSLVITAPIGAVIATDYEVRFSYVPIGGS